MYLLEWDHKYYTVPHHLYPFEIWKSAAALEFMCNRALCTAVKSGNLASIRRQGRTCSSSYGPWQPIGPHDHTMSRRCGWVGPVRVSDGLWVFHNTPRSPIVHLNLSVFPKQYSIPFITAHSHKGFSALGTSWALSTWTVGLPQLV